MSKGAFYMKCKFCDHSFAPTHNRCPHCGRSADVQHGDYTKYFDPKDAEKNHVLATFSYLSFLVLIPIFFGRRSRYTRFHANQGLVLLIVSLAYKLLTRIFINFLDILFGGVYSAIPTTLSTIFNVGTLFFIVIFLLGASNAAKGRAKELPLIGGIRFIS